MASAQAYDDQTLDQIEASFADEADRMTVPVTVNGMGPFAFVVDTGSNRTVISEVLASRLGLPTAGALRVRSATGVAPTESVRIGSLGVGQRRIDNLRAPVLAAHNLGALGMLGIDAVNNQRIVLDFQRGEMSISESRRHDDDAGAVVVKARSQYGQLLLVDSSVEDIPLYVIIDTGAEETAGNLTMRNRLARQRGDKAKAVNLVGVTGDSVLADLSSIPEMRIGQVRVRNQSIAYADLYVFDQFGLRGKPSMLLGMSTLRHCAKLTIDFPAREVSFLL